MNQPRKKGEYEEGGEKGWELTLCLRTDILWSRGNPMPELTLTALQLALNPGRGLRIWALAAEGGTTDSKIHTEKSLTDVMYI